MTRVVGILLVGALGALMALFAVTSSALFGGPNLLDPAVRCTYRLPADLPPEKCRLEHAIDKFGLQGGKLSGQARGKATE